LTSQKRKNFIGSRQRQLGAVHDVPVYPFVQGLSSTIFVSASFLRFMALCFDKANVCHRHDKNDTGDVCFWLNLLTDSLSFADVQMSEFPGENPMSPGGAELATNGDVATMMENFQTKKTSAASMINRLNCGANAGAPASIPAVSAANAVVTSPTSVVAGSRMKRSSQVITDIYSYYLHMYDVPVPVSSSRYSRR
jgi:hypothetical protein